MLQNRSNEESILPKLSGKHVDLSDVETDVGDATLSSVSETPRPVKDYDVVPREELTDARKLTLLPTISLKVVTNIIGCTGLVTGYGVSKLSACMSSEHKITESMAWQAGLNAWMYGNGIFPTVQYDPVSETTRQRLAEMYGGMSFEPENMGMTPVIVNNHVSYLDGPILATLWKTPRFVAKADVRSIPLIGGMLEEAEAIFVERDQLVSRELTKQAIMHHCKEWQPGAKPVVIFPEGTTSNGEGLLDFKNGAFNPGVPVRPAIIVYTGTFNPGVTSFKRTPNGIEATDDAEWATELFGHLVHGCHIRVLQPYIPTEEERNNPGVFARNVKELINKEMIRVKAEILAKSWKVAVGRGTGGVDYECGDFTRLLARSETDAPNFLSMSAYDVVAGLLGCVGVLHDHHSPPYPSVPEDGP